MILYHHYQDVLFIIYFLLTGSVRADDYIGNNCFNGNPVCSSIVVIALLSIAIILATILNKCYRIRKLLKEKMVEEENSNNISDTPSHQVINMNNVNNQQPPRFTDGDGLPPPPYEVVPRPPNYHQ